MLYQQSYHSPLGELTLVSNETALVGLWFKGQKYYQATITGQSVQLQETPVLKQVTRWLDAYFLSKKPSPTEIPLFPQVTAFRRAVLAVLQEVPYGQTRTYGQIAQTLATRLHRRSLSAQAVGGAVGHNPIALLIPCHRIIGSTGKLTGYAAGLAKKAQLLELELGMPLAEKLK